MIYGAERELERGMLMRVLAKGTEEGFVLSYLCAPHQQAACMACINMHRARLT